MQRRGRLSIIPMVLMTSIGAGLLERLGSSKGSEILGAKGRDGGMHTTTRLPKRMAAGLRMCEAGPSIAGDGDQNDWASIGMPKSQVQVEEEDEVALPKSTPVVRWGFWRGGSSRESAPVGILGGVLKNQVDVLASSLWRHGARSVGVQLVLSALSAAALAMSFLMHVSSSLGPDLACPSARSLLWGALSQGFVASSLSLVLSLAHLVWTLGYLRSSGRVRKIAERSATEGLGPLLAKFSSVAKALDVGAVLGLAGAVSPARCISR